VAIERPPRFFFYGTLITGAPPRVRKALSRLSDLGPARMRGRLLAIPDPEGWYPALIAGRQAVAGRLFEATRDFVAADLAAPDAYEVFCPDQPAASLYLRAAGMTDRGPVQVYRFNHPIPEGARHIPDGDFQAWLAREGLTAFAG
jgi:gamma-glutamylcyclotransferase (GGCT)/AIG2-like uncharacterized protein YtfP